MIEFECDRASCPVWYFTSKHRSPFTAGGLPHPARYLRTVSALDRQHQGVNQNEALDCLSASSLLKEVRWVSIWRVMMKNSDASTVPCGTPDNTSCFSDIVPFATTQYFLLHRKLIIHDRSFPFILCFIIFLINM